MEKNDQAQEKDLNNTDQKTDEELLVLKDNETEMDKLSDENLDRLDVLVKGEDKGEVKKRKGWKDDDQVARSYVEAEKHMRQLERELAEAKKSPQTGVSEEKIKETVKEEAKRLMSGEKKELSQEEIKERMAANSSEIAEMLSDPTKAAQAINGIFNFAIKTAREEFKKDFQEELKPLREKEEIREAKALKDEVQAEYIDTIGLIAKRLFNDEEGKAEVFFERIKPRIEAKFESMGEKYQEKPGALKAVVSEIILEGGFLPKNTKTTVDTGDGSKKNFGGKPKLSSKSIETMSEDEISKLTDAEIDEAIKLENKLGNR